MNVNELIQRSHEIALEKGWWPEGIERSMIEQFNNFHAEISEAWEEWRAGRMETWREPVTSQGFGETAKEATADLSRQGHVVSMDTPNFIPAGGGCQASDPAYFRVFGKVIPITGKPEGFWVEIADLLIRIADTAGAYGFKYSFESVSPATGIPEFICCCHKTVAMMWIGHDVERMINILINHSIATADYHSIKLLDLCELKMEYNSKRIYRHGGKRA